MTYEGARHCLTSRSRCYLLLGDHESALLDAEAALKDEPNFIKGIFAKAEALYIKGEFEYALMFYHRGNKLRPELTCFSLGISKASEGIDNAVGTPNKCQLDLTGDMAEFTRHTQITMHNIEKKGKGKEKASKNKGQKTKIATSAKTVKQLLGELYDDRTYLEEMLADPTFVTPSMGRGGAAVRGLVSKGISYLDKRTEFWRQQKPIYARINEVKARRGETTHNSTQDKEKRILDATRRFESRLVQYEEVAESDPERALTNCRDLLYTVSDSAMNGKSLFLARLHDLIGWILLDTSEPIYAAEHFDRGLQLASLEGPPGEQLVSHARINLGRAASAAGNFQAAVDHWKGHGAAEADDVNEWMYHEIGRCQMELEDYGAALESADTALGYNSNNINSMLLKVQAQARLEDFEGAKASMEDFKAKILATDFPDGGELPLSHPLEILSRALIAAESEDQGAAEEVSVSGENVANALETALDAFDDEISTKSVDARL